MCNPPQDGGSIDNAANFTSGMDVHYSSGVYNKAFCTAGHDSRLGHARRRSRCSPAPTPCTGPPSSTFNQGACGVETAATDLGFTKADVTAAFTSVGVSCCAAAVAAAPRRR